MKDALYDSELHKVVFIVHSQGSIEGSIILDWLLAEVPRSLLSKLEIYSFGTAANHWNNPHTHESTIFKNLNVGNLSSPLRRSATLPKVVGETLPNTKAIGHIEHYANQSDWVCRWGVLHFTSSLPSKAGGASFMGRVFERPGSGHQLNQHYLDNMFTLDKTGKVAETNAFMESEVELCENDESQDTRDALADGFHSIFGTGRKRLTVKLRDVSSPIVAPPGDRRWEKVLKNVKVKDVSRLWKYRNGMSPSRFEHCPKCRTIRGEVWSDRKSQHAEIFNWVV